MGLGGFFSYQLSVISYQLSVISYQLSVITNPGGRWVSYFNPTYVLFTDY
ncbi:MAG: hypothetical protein O9324_23065 [Microcystis sp. LE19-84.1B]|nr:hypothetical protein [Microcystis sp. LE19-84.1B]